MPSAENKIKYNISNVHVAKVTVNEGVAVYDTPKKIPGAVSIALAAQGEISKKYADGMVYYQAASNNGYEGDLTVAMIPDWFREEFLGETKDEKGVLTESADSKPVEFALLFEFDGDVNKIRHVFYNCTCTRPSVESQTKEETIEPVDETMTISAAPLPSGKIKSKTTTGTDEATYDAWYTTVYQV